MPPVQNVAFRLKDRLRWYSGSSARTVPASRPSSLIARLHSLQKGSIAIDGHPVDTTLSRDLARILAILKQYPLIASRLTLRKLVSFGRFPHIHGRMASEDRQIVDRARAQFDLIDLSGRFIETLSGGQRQRALLSQCK